MRVDSVTPLAPAAGGVYLRFMAIPLFHVDAFSDAPFGGNPAAVCLLDRPAEAGWMQSVAREMNLSETAFLVPGAERFDLR